MARNTLIIEDLLNVFNKNWLQDPERELKEVKDSMLASGGINQIVGIALQEVIANRSKFYKFGDTFSKHLNRANLKIPIKCLLKPLNLSEKKPVAFFWMDYPLQTNGFKGCIVCVSDKNLTLVVPAQTEVGIYFVRWVLTYTGETLQEAVDAHNWEDGMADDIKIEELKNFLSFAVKSIVYINSNEPDLKAEQKIQTKNPTKFRKRMGVEYPFDIVTVGYGFHGSVVSGHPRLQPCGPGRSEIKLIWIEEHNRNMKKCS